jgi:hypothetical protein
MFRPYLWRPSSGCTNSLVDLSAVVGGRDLALQITRNRNHFLYLWFRAPWIYFIKNQRDAALSGRIYSSLQGYSTCFGCFLHPSSGVQLKLQMQSQVQFMCRCGLNPLKDVQGRESISQCHDQIRTLCMYVYIYIMHTHAHASARARTHTHIWLRTDVLWITGRVWTKTATKLRTEVSGFESRQGQGIFLFSRTSRPALGSAMPHTERVLEFFSEGKATGDWIWPLIPHLVSRIRTSEAKSLTVWKGTAPFCRLYPFVRVTKPCNKFCYFHDMADIMASLKLCSSPQLGYREPHTVAVYRQAQQQGQGRPSCCLSQQQFG